MVVPSRRPRWSLAAATWRSLWVSTPTVTRGSVVCAMVVLAILSSDGTGGRTGRAGGQHCDESGGNRLLSGHAPPVGAAGGGRDAEPTALTAGTRPVVVGVRPRPRPHQWSRGHGLGPTDRSAGTRPVGTRVRPGHRDRTTNSMGPRLGSPGQEQGTQPAESRVRPSPRPPSPSSQWS